MLGVLTAYSQATAVGTLKPVEIPQIGCHRSAAHEGRTYFIDRAVICHRHYRPTFRIMFPY